MFFTIKQALKDCEVVNNCKTWKLVQELSQTATGYKWGVKPIRLNRDTKALPLRHFERFVSRQRTSPLYESSKNIQPSLRFLLTCFYLYLISISFVVLSNAAMRGGILIKEICVKFLMHFSLVGLKSPVVKNAVQTQNSIYRDFFHL